MIKKISETVNQNLPIPITWAVSINANGGSGGGQSPASGVMDVYVGQAVQLSRPANPSYYAFNGWTTNNGAGLSGDTLTVWNQGTTTQVANWLYNGPYYSLTVAYANGCDSTQGTISCYSGCSVDVFGGIGNAYQRNTKVGWTWKGWYYDAQHTNLVSTTIDYYHSYSSNTTLYAWWEKDMYKLQGNPNGRGNIKINGTIVSPTVMSEYWTQDVLTIEAVADNTTYFNIWRTQNSTYNSFISDTNISSITFNQLKNISKGSFVNLFADFLPKYIVVLDKPNGSITYYIKPGSSIGPYNPEPDDSTNCFWYWSFDDGKANTNTTALSFIPTSDVTITEERWSIRSVISTTETTSGNLSIPKGYNQASYTCIGAGGGGYVSSGSYGGGSGGIKTTTVSVSVNGATIPLNIGQGMGTNLKGGDTHFNGGQGIATGGNPGTSTAGGQGGTPSGVNGTTVGGTLSGYTYGAGGDPQKSGMQGQIMYVLYPSSTPPQVP